MTWDSEALLYPSRSGVLTRRISGANYGLINGGKGGMIYTYLGVLLGFGCVVLSMAEMASMYVLFECLADASTVLDC